MATVEALLALSSFHWLIIHRVHSYSSASTLPTLPTHRIHINSPFNAHQIDSYQWNDRYFLTDSSGDEFVNDKIMEWNSVFVK